MKRKDEEIYFSEEDIKKLDEILKMLEEENGKRSWREKIKDIMREMFSNRLYYSF